MRIFILMSASLMTSCMMYSAYAEEYDHDKWLKGVQQGHWRTEKVVQPKYSYDITAFSNCVLENSQGTQTPIQSTRIANACRHKATPKKCRNVSAMPPDSESKSPQEICGVECASAGIWSRKYGDCSLD